MDLPTSSRPPHAHSTRVDVRIAHARRWRCAGILLSVAAVSCAGDEFVSGPGTGGAGATSTASTTTSSGDGGNVGTTASSTVTTGGEGGAAVSTGEGGSGGDGGGSEGGGGSGPVGDCDPEVSGELPIPGSCGVFVDPNRPEGEVGTGTKNDPFRSINDAVAAVAELDERRVYVSESVTDEHVVVTVEGVELHGGLSNQWVYRPEGRTHVRQADDDPEPWAWEIASVPSDVTLRGFRIEGRAASAPGGSSIGLAVRQAFVRLERVEVIAHDAMDGLDGTTPTDDIGVIDGLFDPALAGDVGNPPPDMSQTLGGSGGNGGFNTRPGCSSQGGKGGTGAGSGLVVYQAGDGDRGTSAGVPTGTGGTGASFQNDVFTDCTDGLPGSAGAPGDVGSNASEAGTISPDDGFVPPTATAGGRGGVGDAGGGGGGGRRQSNYDYRGFGGDGGGAGGCGGFGGRPATSGGSSIALLAFDSTIYVESFVSLAAGAGGDGGDAAEGQAGAKGGGAFVRPGDSLACGGGAGRTGGVGGPGGAGAGGHSIGVAHEASQVLGAPTFSLGAAGSPGTSLISEPDGLAPAAGSVLEIRAF